MLRRVDRILLRVPQLQSAVSYYRDIMGLRLLKQDNRVASLRLGDCDAELILHTDPDLPAEAVYYLVDDVRDLYRRRDELRLTFVHAPTQVARGYKATVKDPFGTVLLIVDRTTAHAARGVAEDGKSPGMLFADAPVRIAPRREVLIALYEKIGRTADDLPYTPHFESLYEGYINELSTEKPTRAEVWRHLLNLRKGGKLPKLGEARSKAPEVPPEAKATLRNLLGADIGKRDRLVYTERFDEIAEQFNKTLPRPISPHLLWRLIATLAK
jgi:catechol 2,3-dioxygenase-like lactoylglutathione lyase family enzyme